jgi:hypothetical protein
MSATTTTTTTTNTALAARAAALLTKATAYAVAEKAMAQAIAAKRVHPAMAQDFGAQLGAELPLKTRDFVRVVSNLLAASEKPIKGVVSKRRSEILVVLADLVGALTESTPIALPLWAFARGRAQTAEAEELREAAKLASAEGALNRANAEANAQAEAKAAAAAALAEAKGDTALAEACAMVVANAAALTPDQRQALLLALGAEVAEAAEESAEA